MICLYAPPARRLLNILLTACCLIGSMQLGAAEQEVLRFATYATERPSEELRKMLPFQKNLEASLVAKGISTKVDIRIYPSYDEAIAALIDGKIDFARFGPVSYVLAKQRAPELSLLAVEGHEGNKTFHGVIVVRKDSPIRTLADLQGKRVAFGDPSSTTGRYLPQAEFVKAGLTARDFSSYDYLGRHDKVVFAVAAGEYDAGTTNERTFQKYAADKGLRELIRYPSPTQAWVARNNLAGPTAKAIRASLLEMKGAGLEYIDRNGFLPGTDADYDELRRVMKSANAFGG